MNANDDAANAFSSGYIDANSLSKKVHVTRSNDKTLQIFNNVDKPQDLNPGTLYSTVIQ